MQRVFSVVCSSGPGSFVGLEACFQGVGTHERSLALLCFQPKQSNGRPECRGHRRDAHVSQRTSAGYCTAWNVLNCQYYPLWYERGYFFGKHSRENNAFFTSHLVWRAGFALPAWARRDRGQLIKQKHPRGVTETQTHDSRTQFFLFYLRDIAFNSGWLSLSSRARTIKLQIHAPRRLVRPMQYNDSPTHCWGADLTLCSSFVCLMLAEDSRLSQSSWPPYWRFSWQNVTRGKRSGRCFTNNTLHFLSLVMQIY